MQKFESANTRTSEYLKPQVVEIRGQGLMIGIELQQSCGELVRLALEHRLLINVTADRVIRLLPPLILTPADADLIVQRLVSALHVFLSKPV